MSVTIEQIKALRDLTGVSISLCKKALEDSDGNQEQAIEYMRKQGDLKAAKAEGRATGEGAIAIEIQDNKASIIKLACETDFVARGDEFKALAQNIAKQILAGKTADQFKDEINAFITKVGENIQIIDTQVIEADPSLTTYSIGSYIHSTGKLAALVICDGGDQVLSKDLCMQIVAVNPMFISPEEVSADIVAKEKEIWKENLKNEGKPENIWDKIMIGKEKKFKEENALLTQQFIKDPEKQIKDILGGIKVLKMIRIAL